MWQIENYSSQIAMPKGMIAFVDGKIVERNDSHFGSDQMVQSTLSVGQPRKIISVTDAHKSERSLCDQSKSSPPSQRSTFFHQRLP
jgi:hypothetical protein